VHHCPFCGYTTHRDVAAAQVIRNRGISALGHTVVENVCGDEAAGVVRQDGSEAPPEADLAGSLRSRKPKKWFARYPRLWRRDDVKPSILIFL
jgi:putative transposase